MVATDEGTAAISAAAKRKRVVTSKPTRNGCKTCRFVSTGIEELQYINSLTPTQDTARQVR